jgi:hypothetical protein
MTYHAQSYKALRNRATIQSPNDKISDISAAIIALFGLFYFGTGILSYLARVSQ